jgi:hypothetical protein
MLVQDLTFDDWLTICLAIAKVFFGHAISGLPGRFRNAFKLAAKSLVIVVYLVLGVMIALKLSTWIG